MCVLRSTTTATCIRWPYVRSTPVGCQVELTQAAGQAHNLCGLVFMAWRSLLHLKAGDEVAAQVQVLQATQHAQAAELREAIASKVQSPQVGECRETIEALQEVAVQV